jgi:D-glycero-D-manno-heptose 1,7-bisphosphate phosphatase
VFLDRDGVLTIPEFRNGRSYAPTTLESLELFPRAERALVTLKDAGFALVVVTNQPDVGKGIVELETVEAMHKKLMRVLPLDAIEACYHPRDAGCGCRKPAPGMLLEASSRLGVDMAKSFMVGDRASDVEAGRAAGCRTVFIDLGYTAESAPAKTDHTCGDIGEAARWILDHEL